MPQQRVVAGAPVAAVQLGQAQGEARGRLGRDRRIAAGPLALVTTCEASGVELQRDSAEHSDYERVNALLAEVEARVKQSYLTGPVAAIDRLLHRVDRIDDVVAMWDVRRARAAAWANAEMLWAIRAEPELRAEFVRVLAFEPDVMPGR